VDEGERLGVVGWGREVKRRQCGLQRTGLRNGWTVAREDRRDDDGRLFVPWWLMLKSALRLIEKDRVRKRKKGITKKGDVLVEGERERSLN